MTTPLKLCSANLARIGEAVAVPAFERSAVRPGIVHLGVGGFHRSHQAVYTGRTLCLDSSWGICGVGLTRGDKKMEQTLTQQDHLYTLVTKKAKETSVEVIGSICDYIFAGEGKNTEKVLARLEDEQTRIASLTVTEKAYMLNDTTGDLDDTHPLIQHDLQSPNAPKTPVGFIVEGLRRRMANGHKPFTVLSCDNLPLNGHLTKKIVLQFANRVGGDVGLDQWIDENGAFPNTMVDRITPATTPEDITLVQRDFAIDDAWPVCAEDYTQWVIEDKFTQGRPRWEDAGALIVEDVAPYEHMKLRLLNGSHSALAYLSYLEGHRKVHNAMEDDDVYAFVSEYMEVVKATVPPPSGVSLDAYTHVLRERFSNPNVSDQISRLAEDGSKKMVSFVKDALNELIYEHPDANVDVVAAAVAGWIRYSFAEDLEGKPIEIKDPQAGTLREYAEISKRKGSGPFIGRFIGNQFAASGRFRKRVDHYLDQLEKQGARAVMQSATTGL
eukprot:CAMPEP_0167820630 /NCGR_PEP_ID=MMETSP0112_2-20121227/6217_1 /TAXON_ID=91324 /ORGANISM="Lotharella globosa, Strain CCCM811" /LENGTH=497 /DNA_ID=CAMNT_0007721247 /DNA_START=38 /DNA_END=1531 /DNA_ORIENTATION=-